MPNLKAEQREKVIYEFGILVQPLEDLAKRGIPPSFLDYRVAIAKVQSGDPAWRQTVKDFTTLAPDLFLKQEFQRLSHVPERFWNKLAPALNDPDPYFQEHLERMHAQFQNHVAHLRKEFSDCLKQVPVEWEADVFQANTPFTAYLRIKEAFAVVNERIHYFDSYLHPDFFELFLKTVNKDVSVRLVTTAKGVKAVNAISQLARQEFSDYQLIKYEPAKNNPHDRNLRIDNQIFSLGPGIERAGIALTNFGPTDSSTATHNVFDQIIAKGEIVHNS